MYLSWRIISLENATEFPIFCHTLSEALTLLLQYYLMTIIIIINNIYQMKSNEDMILALAGQFKQLSHEPEKFR